MGIRAHFWLNQVLSFLSLKPTQLLLPPMYNYWPQIKGKSFGKQFPQDGSQRKTLIIKKSFRKLLKDVETRVQRKEKVQKWNVLQLIIIFKMSFLQKTKKAISGIDMFYSTQMLRYNKDTQYQTVTGGIVTLGIIIMVITGFFSMITETINRTAIDSTVNVIKSNNPPAFNLTANAESMFMLGVQIESQDLSFYYNMSGDRRYFDVFVMQYTIQYGVITNQTLIPMVSCTDQHWSILPDLVANKDLLLYDTWLCPHINQQFLLQGGFFSNIFSQIVIQVQACKNETVPERPCYPQEQIDQLFVNYTNFYFAVNYINTVINPSQTNYLSYYIEPMDTIIFSKTQGAQLYYLFTDYTITTDNSIWPFTSTQVDVGCLVQNRAPSRAFSPDNTTGYVEVALAKATDSLIYTRTVQKISAVFSYIGGLVGAISAVLFLIKAYTDTSLQVSIAMSLFNEPKHKQEESPEPKQQEMMEQNDQNGNKQEIKQQKTKKRFNILGFLKLKIYGLLKNFKFTESWSQAKVFDEYRQEIVNHLDIRILLKRLINLQNCVTCIFDQYQLDCLKHQKKLDIDKVKKLRKMLIDDDSDEEQDQLNSGVPSQNIIYCFEDHKEEAKKRVSQKNNFLVPQNHHQNEIEASEQIENSGMQIIKPTPNPNPTPNPDSQQEPQPAMLGDDIGNYGRTDSKTKWITKKTMKSFHLLNKSKEQNFISKKIWQNANDKIKKHVTQNYKQQRLSNFHELIQGKKRSYIKPTLPTIVITKEP